VRTASLPAREGGGTRGNVVGSPVPNKRLRELLFAVVPKIPPRSAEHLCATALRGARI
jgi:hypothetical protein